MTANRRRGPSYGLAVVAVAGVALLGATSQARAVAYTFTPIADWGAGLGSINNEGTVAYVQTSPDGTQRVLKTAMDGTTTVIADTAGSLNNFHFSDHQGTTPSINDQGLVAFVAGTDAGATGIYTGSGGTLRLLEEIAMAVGTRPYLNNSGQVAYYRQPSSGTGIQIVIDTDGVQATVSTADSQNGSVFMRGIDSNGKVLFCRDAINEPDKWFIGDASSQIELPSTDGTFTGFASLSDYQAVLAGSLLDGGEAIYSYKDGAMTPLVDTSGTIKSFREIATNNHGDWVFMATLDYENVAIFSDVDLANPIVSTGDSLLGSSVTNLMMFPSLNDSGQFVFQAQLTDHRTVLVRADVVPEPTGLCLVLGGLVVAAFRRGSRVPR